MLLIFCFKNILFIGNWRPPSIRSLRTYVWSKVVFCCVLLFSCFFRFLCMPILNEFSLFNFRQSSVAPFSTRTSNVGATGSSSSPTVHSHHRHHPHRSSPTMISTAVPSGSGGGVINNNAVGNGNNNLASCPSGGGYSSDGDSDEE